MTPVGAARPPTRGVAGGLHWNAARSATAAAAAALALAAPAAAHNPERWPPPPCPTLGALVGYHAGGGLDYESRELVVGPGRTACLRSTFVGPLVDASGRTTFVVSRSELAKLVAALGRIDVGHLGPPPPRPPWSDYGNDVLVYAGRTIPRYELVETPALAQGYPQTPAGVRALRRAEAILEGIIRRHSPR